MSEQLDPNTEATNPAKAATRDDTVFIFKAKDGFRWHRIAINGKIVAESGEAFQRHSYAVRSATRNNPGVLVDDG